MGQLIRYFFVLLCGIAIGFYLPDDVQRAQQNVWNKITKSENPSLITPPTKTKIAKPAVELKAPVTPAVPPEAQKLPPPAPEAKTLFTVQVGSFTKKNQAQKFVDELHLQQIDAYIAPQDLALNQNVYRVYVGEHLNRPDAENQKADLAKRFKGAFVKSF